MRFTPQQEQSTKPKLSLLPPSIYNFKVAMATNAVSKKGNQMIKLVLTIEDNAGNLHSINDYLLDSMPHKLRNFCKSTNILPQYERGELNPFDCVHKTGLVKIIIEEGSFREDGSRYPNRNSVKDYITKSISKQSAIIQDDEIAF